MGKKNIVHIITGLGNGGAEMMLYKLLEKSDKSKFNFKVISMLDEGIMGEKINNLGVPVYTLKMKRGVPSLFSIIKTINICKNADIIQSWMYHADLLSFIVGKIFLKKRVIWGIRRANLEKDKNKRSTLLIAKINSILSKYIDKVISCSIEAKKTHLEYGFFNNNIEVIPNGFSIEKYFYDKNAKNLIRKELEISLNRIVLILAGRWNILKDHNNCLEALRILKNSGYEVLLVFCGTEMDTKNVELMKLIYDKGLNNEVMLLGRREDIPQLFSASDIYVSSSSGEGFPNVIGEAMACELPCVVTDVGDSSYIIGNTGIVVPRQSPEKLADGIIKMINFSPEERKKLGEKARHRIISNFEIGEIVKCYEKLY